MFNLSDGVIEDLRHLILNFQTVDITELTKLPILVTYLHTKGGQAAYTENQVGFATYGVHRIILMNDFVIQFFETEKDAVCANFNGLNDPADFTEFVNVHEETFLLKIFSNNQRQNFLQSNLKESIPDVIHFFRVKHIARFRQEPTDRMIGHFMAVLSDESKDIALGVRYGEERLEVIANTILDKIALETTRHRFRRR